MRVLLAVFLALLTQSPTRADEAKVVAKPDTFPTLVNPNCSHCVDEAKRRAKELRDDDPVLMWTRGYSDGGAIPLRFFLSKHRVISDSYGVFVYDPDAGFARGFAPSYNFTFHGWRNGIMVIKDAKDGTLYSALSGLAFEGAKKGQRLKSVPTLTTIWGPLLKAYPNAVAYHMFNRFEPVELQKETNADSMKTRPSKTDPRLKSEELVLGVKVGDRTKAFPVQRLANTGFLGATVFSDTIGGEPIVVLYDRSMRAAAAYKQFAHQPRKFKAPQPDKDGVSPPDKGIPLPIGSKPEKPRTVKLETAAPRPLTNPAGRPSKVVDEDTTTIWDVAGRATEGELKGWTLEPVDFVVCKWFAWSAEYPETEVFGQAKPDEKKEDAIKEIAGAAEFLRLLPKPFATLKAVDAKARTVTLLIEGETVAKGWPVEPDAEVKVMGWWGRLEQLKPDDRVWVWMKLNRKKEPVSICMIADEPSEQDIHGDGLVVLSINKENVTFTTKKQPNRTLDAGNATIVFDQKKRSIEELELAQKLFVQTAGQTARLIVSPTVFEEHRKSQKDHLRALWIKDGLPGTVSVQHVFSGELEILIDHEGMQWARTLKSGDVVHIQAEPAIKAVVKAQSAWRERTLLRLVVGELAAADLKPGDRAFVKMKSPAEEVLSAAHPPDIDRERTRDQRVEWFLANTYCVCKIRGDICTGHFYTLASCNPNGCGAPNETRQKVRELIDKGLNDRQIWDALLKEKGSSMLKPHLLP